MIQIRTNAFETNSSSTHSLAICNVSTLENHIAYIKSLINDENENETCEREYEITVHESTSNVVNVNFINEADGECWFNAIKSTHSLRAHINLYFTLLMMYATNNGKNYFTESFEFIKSQLLVLDFFATEHGLSISYERLLMRYDEHDFTPWLSDFENVVDEMTRYINNHTLLIFFENHAHDAFVSCDLMYHGSRETKIDIS